MLEKLKMIVEGWKNYTFKDPEIEKMAQIRADICSLCPHSVEGMIKVPENGAIVQIQGMKCDQCGCPLSSKTRSPNSECPKYKWPMRKNQLVTGLETIKSSLCKALQELLSHKKYGDKKYDEEKLKSLFAKAIDEASNAIVLVNKMFDIEVSFEKYTPGSIYFGAKNRINNPGTQLQYTSAVIMQAVKTTYGLTEVPRLLDDANNHVEFPERGSLKDLYLAVQDLSDNLHKVVLGLDEPEAKTDDEVSPVESFENKGSSDYVESLKNDDEPYIVTEEDIKMNPELLENGIKEGDTIMLPKTDMTDIEGHEESEVTDVTSENSEDAASGE